MSDQSKQIFKLILMGDGAVGKTSLRGRFMGGKFEMEYMLTIGADFAVKSLDIGRRSLVMQIWDLAGQDRFKDVRDKYYRNAKGLIIVFDLTTHESFKHVPDWISEYLDNSEGEMVPIVLLGNKSDLDETGRRSVSDQEIANYMTVLRKWGTSNHKNFNVDYLETSAKTGVNVDEAFHLLGKKMLDHYDSKGYTGVF